MSWGVVVVDDHNMFRDAVKYILDQSGKAHVTAESSNAQEFFDILELHHEDIVLMDLSLPDKNGIETTAEAVARFPNLKIIALSMFSDNYQYYDMLKAGAKGVLLKESGSDELLEAIELVGRGETYLTNKIFRNIIRSAVPSSGKGEKDDVKNLLTNKELAVLKYLSKGFSNKEIGEVLDLSPRTIEGIRSSLLSKTGTENSIKLVLFGIEHGII